MPIDYENIVMNLPRKPGVYQFVDSNGVIIYAGKAKNLRKRVASYFTRNQSGKTLVMLKKATGIEHFIVDNESDALLLENNIIKKHKPRYNILLKDDKSFPWICIKNEPFPRVFISRKIFRNGSLYFGPYTSGLMVKILLELLNRIFKIRTCTLNLSSDNISAGKYKVCLEYHLGNCLGPCAGLQTGKEYNDNINSTKSILKGNIATVIDELKQMMIDFSGQMKFEEAQAIKNKIGILSNYQGRSVIVNPKIKNIDVFGLTRDDSNMYINYMKVVNGAVIQSFTLDLQCRIEEENDSLLGSAITEIRQRVSSDSPEVIVPFIPDILFDEIKYTVPSRGDKNKLLLLATRNAIYYKLEKKSRNVKQGRKIKASGHLEKMRADLHLPDTPVHIECFDISNLTGRNQVAACVVFRHGKPSRREYRRYNIKTVTGPDDFASMEEVVFRRYKRMLGENAELPRLVIIDGGKGQLSSATRSLDRLGIKDKIPVIGIAKRLEEIYFPGDNVPLYLDKNSFTLKIIQQLRNEAHRFGINFHRQKRSAGLLKSDLDGIKGIGIKTKETLVEKIGSTDKIRTTSVFELEKLIGKRRASIIMKKLKK
jgi:excinuclease ABC subunit C